MCFLVIHKQDFEYDNVSFLLLEVWAKSLVLNLWTDFFQIPEGAHI